MTTLVYSTREGLHVRLPDGTRRFLPESEEVWEREHQVAYAPLRLSTAQRAAKYLNVSARSIRVVRTREELK